MTKPSHPTAQAEPVEVLPHHRSGGARRGPPTPPFGLSLSTGTSPRVKQFVAVFRSLVIWHSLRWWCGSGSRAGVARRSAPLRPNRTTHAVEWPMRRTGASAMPSPVGAWIRSPLFGRWRVTHRRLCRWPLPSRTCFLLRIACSSKTSPLKDRLHIYRRACVDARRRGPRYEPLDRTPFEARAPGTSGSPSSPVAGLTCGVYLLTHVRLEEGMRAANSGYSVHRAGCSVGAMRAGGVGGT